MNLETNLSSSPFNSFGCLSEVSTICLLLLTKVLKILKNISECGYTFDITVINSNEAGVPQSRERTYIVGVYNKDTEKKGIAEIIIAKQRNGPIGTVELVWLPDYTKFANLQK